MGAERAAHAGRRQGWGSWGLRLGNGSLVCHFVKERRNINVGLGRCLKVQQARLRGVGASVRLRHLRGGWGWRGVGVRWGGVGVAWGGVEVGVRWGGVQARARVRQVGSGDRMKERPPPPAAGPGTQAWHACIPPLEGAPAAKQTCRGHPAQAPLCSSNPQQCQLLLPCFCCPRARATEGPAPQAGGRLAGRTHGQAETGPGSVSTHLARLIGQVHFVAHQRDDEVGVLHILPQLPHPPAGGAA